jgi:DNA-binding transcriptional ArsR family regulator
MPSDRLSLTFAALADPTRRSILTRLARGEATVNQLAEPFAVSLPAISRHLKVLERAGLIVRSREAQWRPSRRGGGVDAVAQTDVGSPHGQARSASAPERRTR